MAASVSKPAVSNRKSFVRIEVPLWERAASWIILVLLLGVATAIWMKGRHYDPGRFALRSEALSSTTATIAGKSGTVSGASDGRPVKTETAVVQSMSEAVEGVEDYEAAAVLHAALPAVSPSGGPEPLEVELQGVAPMGPTEFYEADNLFEKIDGRAPAYLGFNFQQLRCRTFSVSGGNGSYVDVFEYRFDTPINAFGMFALERDLEGKPIDFAPDGYGGDMGFFFRQGVYYVQIMASDQEPGTLASARRIAENRAKAVPADDTGLAARRRLPPEGLDPASVVFVAENALGQSFLKDVFQATYDFGHKELSFFLMVTSPDDAMSAWNSYQAFATRIGGQVTVLPEMNGAKLFQAENFGSWSVIYQRKGEIGGVYEADDIETARQFIAQQLQESSP